jgi:hypothetical protein
MTKPNDLVTPYAWKMGADNKTPIVNTDTGALTKLEYFAAMALNGLSAALKVGDNTATDHARIAVDYAEALVEELNKRANSSL